MKKSLPEKYKNIGDMSANSFNEIIDYLAELTEVVEGKQDKDTYSDNLNYALYL